MVQSVHAVLRNALRVGAPRGSYPAQRHQTGPGSARQIHRLNRRLSITHSRSSTATGSACTPSTSWRSASACAEANYLVCAGRTSTSTRAHWRDGLPDAATGWRGAASSSDQDDDSARADPASRRSASARCGSTVAQQFTERADAWPNWREHGLVFPTRIGTPMEPDNLRRSWSRIRTAAGLTGTTDSRHQAHVRLPAAPPGCRTRHGSGDRRSQRPRSHDDDLRAHRRSMRNARH